MGGVKIISREGKIHIYIHKKARSQAQRKIKPQRIKWTTAWRRLNKKIKTTDVGKKKRRKAKRVVREITGMTADEINRRKAETTGDREARKSEARQGQHQTSPTKAARQTPKGRQGRQKINC